VALTDGVRAIAAISQRWRSITRRCGACPARALPMEHQVGQAPVAARLPAGIKQGAVALTDGVQAIAAIIQRWAQHHA